MALVDPLVVLQARMLARARMWIDGQCNTVAELMQPLYDAAERDGLFDQLGGRVGIDTMMLEILERMDLPFMKKRGDRLVITLPNGITAIRRSSQRG
jgi:Fe-S cluster assembly iron-binding protein IscA